MLLSVLAAVPAGRADEPFELPAPYHAEGKDSWDFWFIQESRVYYAFYLQSPIDQPQRFSDPTIGLATSTDLLHWTEVGEVLRANPPGMWNDGWVATGSIMRIGGAWKKIFTGHTYTGFRGLAAAVSNDLVTWTRSGAGGPLPVANTHYVVPVSDYWQSKNLAPGRLLRYEVLADPYVMPDPIGGWYYMVVSALLDGVPTEERGCVALLRSRDGEQWQSVGLIAAPREYWECEAPQIWFRDGRWYLMFGAARSEPLYRATMVYTADTILGPFEPNPRSELRLPNWDGWFYVAKVVRAPSGRDVLIGGVGGRMSWPYPITYEADGSLTLTEYEPSVSVWLPDAAYLRAPSPNPARGPTAIEYGLARAGRVIIEVYDVSGRRVSTLQNGPVEAGDWRVVWDGRDGDGRRLRAGVYFVHMRGGGFDHTRKVVLAE